MRNRFSAARDHAPGPVAIIPVRISADRHARQLERCVEAVLAGRGGCEVVVVDDGSSLPLPALPPVVQVVRLSRNRGPAAARNAGIAVALDRGADVALFTDADCLPEPTWAAALVAALRAGPHVAVGGVTRSLGRTLLDRYHDFAGSLNGRWIQPGREALLYATTCNMAVRAEALAAVRFDERFPTAAGEDVDFSVRLREHGTIGLVPGAVVRHDFAYPGTWRGLPAFRAMFRRYGQADPVLWSLHPQLQDACSEACAAADLLAWTPPADPAAYGRGASSRVRPRRFRLPMVLLRHVARRAYRDGQASPLPRRG